MPTKEPYLLNRLKSIKYALKGVAVLLKKERSIQIQFVIAVFITVAGFYFKISSLEWIAQILAIGLVMSIEGLNTALEEFSDFVHPERHSKIGLIKDLAAGAVFIAAVAAVLIGLIIYIPKLT